MDDDEGTFPETLTIAGYNKSLLAGLQRAYPREEWQEVAEYKLVKVRRVRYATVWEDEK